MNPPTPRWYDRLCDVLVRVIVIIYIAVMLYALFTAPVYAAILVLFAAAIAFTTAQMKDGGMR